jgi:hypothetical protein
MGLAGEGDLNHGRDQGGGEAVARDIGDQNADTLVVKLNEIVEIAGDGGHGGVAGGDIKARELRNRVGKNGELDLAGHLEFLVEGFELGSQLSAGFAKHDVTAHTSCDDGGRKGLVDVINGAAIEAAGFIFGAGLAGKEDDGNVTGRRIRLEAVADFVTIDARHHDVEKDEVGFFFGVGESEALFTIGGNFGAEGIF